VYSFFKQLLEVLKMDVFNSKKMPVGAFLELVVRMSEPRHANIFGLN